MRRRVLLIVSPHPDDSALSLGASILKYPKLETVVWNVFSYQNYSLIDSDPARARRRILEEEREASVLLGTKVLMGGFPEAELRGYARLSDRLGHDPNTLFSRVAERRLCRRLEKAFERVLGDVRPSFLALPLGVGGHADHLLVREAALARLADDSATVPQTFFYEDLPYGLDPAWRERPLVELESRGHCLKERFVDVTGLMERKGDVLRVYRSQLRERDIRRLARHASSLRDRGRESERIWLLNRASYESRAAAPQVRAWEPRGAFKSRAVPAPGGEVHP